MEKLLTKEEKENLPIDLTWEWTEKAEEFTYRVEAFDKKTNTLYTGYCDIGEFNILDWRWADRNDDIYAKTLD